MLMTKYPPMKHTKGRQTMMYGRIFRIFTQIPKHKTMVRH